MNDNKCLKGYCVQCKFWKLQEWLPGNKGKCDKRDYLISCSHSCCEDYTEKGDLK